MTADIRVDELRLRNFKGIRDFSLKSDGADSDIWGDNATGKTTLFDAFLWLLFDKDSANKKDFSIKTLASGGQVKTHGIEHEVEGVLIIDNQRVAFRKVYYERWTKKRGSIDRKFEGNTTDYYIDGVPVKKGEYTARVAEICDESVFRLLTDPGYFNQIMKWTDRRALLLEVCGDLTESEVIASDDALAQLPEILGKRTLDEHRKVIAARRSEINKELERIPDRIDEVSRSIPEVAGTADSVESELKQIRVHVQEKHKEKARLTDGGAAAAKTKRLRELEAELLEHQNKARAQADEANWEARERAEEVNRAAGHARRQVIDRIDEIDRTIRSRQQDIESNVGTIDHLEAEMVGLREKWRLVDADAFEDSTEMVCAACGQDLPVDKVEGAREKALASFNKSKAERLERIDEEGKRAKTRAGELSLANERIRKEIAELTAERDRLEAEKPADVAEIAPALVEPDLSCPPLETEISSLKDEIGSIGFGNAEDLAALEDEIRHLQQQIKDGEAALAAFDQVTRARARIDELKAQEKALTIEFERLEKELYLTEQFVRAKVRLLTEKINSKFKMARFKLFNELVNGALEECCETTVGGVPYSDLNNGARINVGLDIINTLSEHYGFAAPIFVDNAEAVTQLTDTRGQMIRLVVSAADKQLRVETKSALKEAVNG